MWEPVLVVPENAAGIAHWLDQWINGLPFRLSISKSTAEVPWPEAVYTPCGTCVTAFANGVSRQAGLSIHLSNVTFTAPSCEVNGLLIYPKVTQSRDPREIKIEYLTIEYGCVVVNTITLKQSVQ